MKKKISMNGYIQKSKLIITIILLSLSNFSFAQTDIVTKFWNTIAKACKERDNIYLENSKDYVGDILSTEFDDIIANQYCNGDAKFEQWYAVFEDKMYSDKGVSVKINFITKKYEEPNFYDSNPSVWYHADISLTMEGQPTRYSAYYRVKDNKIQAVNKEGSKLQKALDYYKVEQNYDKAFSLFREIAYERLNNNDAQYYTCIMLLKDQGCKKINKTSRLREAYHWTCKGSLFNDKRFEGIMTRFFVKKSFEIYMTITDKNDCAIYEDQFVFFPPFSKNGLCAYLEKGKFGYVDINDKVVIKPQFEVATNFGDNGLALVKKNGKYGYINQQGTFVIPAVYDYATYFVPKTQNAVVSRNGTISIIRSDGSIELSKKIDGKISLPFTTLRAICIGGRLYDRQLNLIRNKNNSKTIKYYIKSNTITYKNQDGVILTDFINWYYNQ